jgi:hypothetical protein
MAVTFWMTGSALFANPLVVIALLIAGPDNEAALTAAGAALMGQITGQRAGRSSHGDSSGRSAEPRNKDRM